MDTHLVRIRFWHMADINEEAERLGESLAECKCVGWGVP